MNLRRGHCRKYPGGNPFHKSIENDAVGRQTSVMDALTNRTDSVYDAAGRLQCSTNALGYVTRYLYDAKGRQIKTIFADNSYTTNSYNEVGQL